MIEPCTIAQLREILDLDITTGRLTWRPRGSHLFAAQDRCDVWNSRFAGKPAFEYVGVYGYRRGSIFNRSVLAHRVVWALHTGSWPSGELDHINGDGSDNRPGNLRDVGRDQNGKNLALRRSNRSGTPGVDQMPCGSWRARIKVSRQHLHLGTFATEAEAVAARKLAEVEHGFHPNHGRDRHAA